MVDDFIIVCKKLLDAGHGLVIVSKPRLECIEKICDALGEYKTQLIFRFSISTLDEELIKKYEPSAPGVEERIECLKLAFSIGFRT